MSKSSRASKAKTERIYLLDATRRNYSGLFGASTLPSTLLPSWNFKVQGASGSHYDVDMGINSSSCTCRDFQFSKKQCKHIKFVTLRVLKLEKYQNKLTEEMDAKLTELFTQTVVGLASVEPKSVVGESCAICYEDFVEDGDKCEFCAACGNGIHPECVAAWLKSKTTCPLCRGNWVAKPKLEASAACVEAALQDEALAKFVDKSFVAALTKEAALKLLSEEDLARISTTLEGTYNRASVERLAQKLKEEEAETLAALRKVEKDMREVKAAKKRVEKALKTKQDRDELREALIHHTKPPTAAQARKVARVTSVSVHGPLYGDCPLWGEKQHLELDEQLILCDSVESVSLDRFAISLGDLEKILSKIPSTVASLSLTRSRLTDESCGLLAAKLREMTNLTQLDLGGNSFWIQSDWENCFALPAEKREELAGSGLLRVLEALSETKTIQSFVMTNNRWEICHMEGLIHLANACASLVRVSRSQNNDPREKQTSTASEAELQRLKYGFELYDQLDKLLHRNASKVEEQSHSSKKSKVMEKEEGRE